MAHFTQWFRRSYCEACGPLISLTSLNIDRRVCLPHFNQSRPAAPSLRQHIIYIYNWVKLLCKYKFTSDYIKYGRSPNSIKDMLQCFHALNCFSPYSNLAIISTSRNIRIITIKRCSYLGSWLSNILLLVTVRAIKYAQRFYQLRL